MALHKRWMNNVVVVSSCFAFSTRFGRLHASSSSSVTSFIGKMNRTFSSTTTTTTLDSTPRTYQDILQVAVEAAKQAGSIMKRTTGQIEVSKTKVNTADLVTESDLECQRIIRKVILDAFPNDSFLGEEDIDAGRNASISALQRALSSSISDRSESYLWIVDPIDGTTNFQAGLPLFGASIGVLKVSNTVTPAEIVVGVIYNPILDEMTTAVRGKGCFVNGQRIQHKTCNTSVRLQLRDALVCVGFPASSTSALEASSRAVAALSTKVRGIRMIASAAQVMCWVAQKKLSAYIGWNLNAWDAAAGILIIEESGGCLRNFDGTRADVSSRDMIMTCFDHSPSHDLNEEIRQLMIENDCLRYDK